MKQKKSNKVIRTISILILIGLVFTHTFAYESKVMFQTLAFSLLVLVVLTIVLWDESKLKISELFLGRLMFSRGLAYCLVSLPVFLNIVKEPRPGNHLEQSIVYFLVLFLSVFHFGTSLRSNNYE